MIPLRDDIQALRAPVVTLTLIGFTALVFAWQATGSGGLEDSVDRFGMIPARVSDPDVLLLRPGPSVGGWFNIQTEVPYAESALPAWMTLLSCVFLHGGLLHLLGNIWFLWIFGDNVEDRFGRGTFLGFYLASGVFASFVHYLSDPHSAIPTIGASGAVAGVMGAYMVLYPRAVVLTLIPLFFLFPVVALPAFLFLGIWFVIQLFNGSQMDIGSGVAWWAHIGGFIIGAAFAWWFRRKEEEPRHSRRRPTRPLSVVRVYRPRSRW